MPLTATSPRRSEFSSLSPRGFHRVVYYEWGDAGNSRVVVCVHGVGRNGRDFDVLGEALAPTHRVLAVDMPGRGASEWLADPNDYVFPTYLTTLVALIARSGAQSVDWVGTSMGGLLGIVAAGAIRAGEAPLAAHHIRNAGLPRMVQVEARLVVEPKRWAPDRVRLLVETERVDGAPRSGLIQLTAYGVLPALTQGQRVAAPMRLHPAMGFRNPGTYDNAAHLAREDFDQPSLFERAHDG